MSRLGMGLGKMMPGTLGGQSRTATPIGVRQMPLVRIIKSECPIKVEVSWTHPWPGEDDLSYGSITSFGESGALDSYLFYVNEGS